MTDTADEAIYLDDLSEPRYSAEAQQLRAMMASLATDCPLDADVLHARASEATGLSDFGPDDYRERLDRYVAELREIEMHGPGIVNFHAQLVQWLKNRLLLTDLLTRHPEIDDIELAPPVVIAGLPRSGTTHLHNMLAAAPTFRSLPYWESVEPFPLPAEIGVEPDPRIGRMDVAVQTMDLLMPYFPLMHEMTTDHVHEEIQLLANDFSTMLMETLAHVPGGPTTTGAGIRRPCTNIWSPSSKRCSSFAGAGDGSSNLRNTSVSSRFSTRSCPLPPWCSLTGTRYPWHCR